jgi:hypothetical protein
MAGKTKKTTKSKNSDSAPVNPTFVAQVTLRPSLNAAAVIAEWGKAFGEQDIGELMLQLSESAKALESNDLHRCEAMLFTQAHALQAIFTNLSRRAANQEYLKQFETHLRLALKAQAQCVRTLEVLAAIKNPQPVAFVKQANIAQNQQVNNGAVPVPGGLSKIQSEPNESDGNPAESATETLYLNSPARGENENLQNELLSPPAHASL